MRVGLLALLFFVSMSISAQNWYRSNSTGMQLGSLAGLIEQGWVLEVNGGNRTLYQNGQAVERWNEFYSNGVRSVEYWKGQERRELKIYRPDGLLNRVERFVAGSKVGEDRYFYLGRWLVRIEHQDGKGQLVWRKTYQRRANGSMVSSYQRVVSGEGSKVAYAMIDAGLTRLTKRGRNERIEVFDSEGNLYQKKEFHGDTLFRQVEFRRRNGEIVEETMWYPERKETQVLSYNDDQQLIRKTLVSDGRLLEFISYRYDENKLLREEKRVGQELLTLRYSYRPGSDKLETIDYYQRGVLIHTRFDFQPEPASYSEKFYVNGQAMVLRIYRNNALVEEKLLKKKSAPARHNLSQNGL